MHLGLCLFLESKEHDFIKALMINTDNQIVTELSWQSIRLMIQRLWVQTPLGAIFDKIYFALCNFKSDINTYREKLNCTITYGSLFMQFKCNVIQKKF